MASVMSEEIKELPDIIQVYIHLTKEVLPSIAKKRVQIGQFMKTTVFSELY